MTANEICPACGQLVELHGFKDVRESCPKTWTPGVTKRGGRAPRPRAVPQSDALFDEPERQQRTLVPLAHTPADALFDEPRKRDRRLVEVDGWPDYQRARNGGDRDAT